MGRKLILSGVLGLHLVVAVFHGASHGLLGVTLPAWQNALVLATTFLSPILGVALVYKGHPWGIPLFTVAMAGSLAIGGLLHFFLENPDHIMVIPTGTWHASFQLSAGGVAVTATIGALTGSWAWMTE